MQLAYTSVGPSAAARRCTPEERLAARATRRPSRNNSHTIYHFNDEGIADYVYNFHQSFHGHGYTVEMMLQDGTLTRRVCHENGAVRVEGGLPAAVWCSSQRRDLLV